MASPSTESIKDLFSESTGKVQPLPVAGEVQDDARTEEEEKEWLKEMTERADRESGQAEVQFAVGQYHFGRGNYNKALKYFEKAAQMSDGSGTEWDSSLQAKYQLGVMYYDGLGVEEDLVRGTQYMQQVAESKLKRDANIVPSAQYNLGRAYFMGFGVPQSDIEAEKWWESAASLGTDPSSIRAMHTLALYYSRNESLDLKKSFRWHESAARDGNPESMAVVGAMLVQGQGCDMNAQAGLSWLKKSVQKGCVYGEGVLSRHYLAMKLFSKAVETAFRWDCMGIAMACFVFARCMQLGNAVVKNEVKAMTYFEKAKAFDRRVTADMHDQLLHNQL